MHILGIVITIVFSVMAVLAVTFFVLSWFNARLVKKLRKDGFYD